MSSNSFHFLKSENQNPVVIDSPLKSTGKIQHILKRMEDSLELANPGAFP